MVFLTTDIIQLAVTKMAANLEERKEAAIARGAFFGGFVGGAILGGAIVFILMISIVTDVKNSYHSLRSEALERGHVQYNYDKEGNPVLEWQKGDEIDSTTTRGETQAETAQSN